jgi:ribosomal protein S18 acetylase RimI-like enzyme
MIMTDAATPLPIAEATPDDLEGILKLQYLCYQIEAERYDFWTIPALTQSLASLAEDLRTKPVLVARIGGEVVGSVRGGRSGDDFHIGRLVVHPRVQRRGLGGRLLREIEARAGDVRRFESYTGYRSTEFLAVFTGSGYRPFREEKVSDRLRLTYLEKARPA